MKNYDKSVKRNHNANWPHLPGHPYRIFTIGGSGSGKTNVLLNLLKHHQQDIEKSIYSSNIHSYQSINCLLMEEKK